MYFDVEIKMSSIKEQWDKLYKEFALGYFLIYYRKKDSFYVRVISKDSVEELKGFLDLLNSGKEDMQAIFRFNYE